ncbi:MAG: DUF59 domain-containing protein [Candidatus Thermoplasmatota archaeon]|nr:DUF59 domain-containing protein [Candidatus Thermoplasmatota archaeon]
MATESEVISSLREIVDPHSNINLYDMGLISELKVSKDSVSLTFRPTSAFCPLGIQFAQNIKRNLLGLKGVKKADVKVIGHVQERIINKSLHET